MRVADLAKSFDTNEFPYSHVHEHPDRSAVVAGAARVQAALCDDEFLVDCIGYELRRLQARPWALVGLRPFCALASRGIRFSCGHWDPGLSTNPHEHTSWTITGVLRNQLEVSTFDHVESYRLGTLVPKNRFNAAAGKAGFIYSHGIHAPANPTQSWTLSLHVSGPLDGERPSGSPGPLALLPIARRYPPHPYTAALRARRRIGVVGHLLELLLQSTQKKSLSLKRCAELGSIAMRRRIIQSGELDDLGEASLLNASLSLTHAGIELRCRDEHDAPSLEVLNHDGQFEFAPLDDVPPETVLFVASHATFELAALPGCTSDEQRLHVADSLQRSGLFKLHHPRC